MQKRNLTNAIIFAMDIAILAKQIQRVRKDIRFFMRMR
jgi:hypothetical protein